MDSLFFLKALTLFAGFYMAWNIGSNDVSNAMGTSVGSKALTLTHAVILAAILEFSGAFFLGSHVSETIQSDIIDLAYFQNSPLYFILGMTGALLATGIWLNIASYFKLPISTTHAIIGAIAGFGIIWGGFAAVQWGQIGYIVLSWVISPLLSGIIAFLIFSLIQKKILYNLNPIQAAKNLIPIFIFFVVLIFTFSLIYNGLGTLHLNLSFWHSLALSVAAGLFSWLVVFALTRKITITACNIKRPAHPIQLQLLEKAYHNTMQENSAEGQNKQAELLKEIEELKLTIQNQSQYQAASSEYHRIEKSFAWLQILSAALVAFAHGANDVANAIGPISAVFSTMKAHSIHFNPNIPLWILILGGVGIVIGLATWGWRVIETIGKKITELTPTRGFSAEFSAAITILFASKLGLPISTTHALVGAIFGVGLARGIKALNLKTLKDIVLSWIATIPICMVLSILVFYILKFFF